MLLLILITYSKKHDIVQLPSLLPRQTIGPSGTQDKGKKSGTVPEIGAYAVHMMITNVSVADFTVHVHVLSPSTATGRDRSLERLLENEKMNFKVLAERVHTHTHDYAIHT